MSQTIEDTFWQLLHILYFVCGVLSYGLLRTLLVKI